MELTAQLKSVLVTHGVTKRSAQYVVLLFVDALYDLVTEDRGIGGIEDVFAHMMSEDDFDEIRETCSDTENLVRRSVVRTWIKFGAKTRRAYLTEEGRAVARALAPHMGWPASAMGAEGGGR